MVGVGSRILGNILLIASRALVVFFNDSIKTNLNLLRIESHLFKRQNQFFDIQWIDSSQE